MKQTAIDISNLSKSFVIRHETREQYDSFAALVSGRFRELLGLKSNKPRLTNIIPTRQKREEFWALRDINMKVLKGERVGIIGRNGAGKSTLFKIMSKITPPTTGRVVLDGKTSSLLEVGTGFHPDLSGKENIFLNGAILGMSRREINARMEQIIDFAEIENFIDTPVKYYSSGMYVRLAFSVAAHLDPEILIVDEVLAVGDLRFQKKCLGKMEEVSRREGRTILFVSHNLDAIRSLCDRGVLLEQGRIARDSSVQEAIARYIETEEIKYASHYPYLGTYPQITSVSIDKHQLEAGNLELDIEFASPYELRPIPGFVVYNIANVPVMGSNPRYHSEVDDIAPRKEGRIRALLNTLELHTGYYKVSVWLGDLNNDYDQKPESIVFYYQNPRSYISAPDPLNIGAIDKNCYWQFADKQLVQDINHQP